MVRHFLNTDAAITMFKRLLNERRQWITQRGATNQPPMAVVIHLAAINMPTIEVMNPALGNTHGWITVDKNRNMHQRAYVFATI